MLAFLFVFQNTVQHPIGAAVPGVFTPRMNKHLSRMSLSDKNPAEGKIHQDHLASKILTHYSRYHPSQNVPFIPLKRTMLRPE